MKAYVKFVDMGEGKWDVYPTVVKDPKELGTIEWNNSWKTYVFIPTGEVNYPWSYVQFSPDCLRAIAEFMEKQEEEKK